MAWLLDTNVLSELRKPIPNPKVLSFIASCRSSELYVSTVTLAEIRYGIEIVTDPVRRSALAHWLEQVVRPMFYGRVLPITEEVMLRWRILVETGRKAGHTFSQPDLILAATALDHNLRVATRDRSDFDRAGVAVHNPWDAETLTQP